MKITKVDVFEVHTRRPAWRPVLCRIYTDEGIYGDGEAALAYGTAAPAAAGMIRDLATLIIGMDPLDNEVIWDKLYMAAPWFSPAFPHWTSPSGISRANTSAYPSTSCWAASAGTICVLMPASSSSDGEMSVVTAWK